MKIGTLILALWSISAMAVLAQESNNNKQIWAKSILNEQTPQIEVEKGLGKTPQFLNGNLYS